MSVEPAGGTISGNNPNVITDQQLFDHATSDPTPAPATSPPPSGPGPSPSPSGDPSSAPASTRPDLQQPAQPQGQPRDEGGRFAPRPQGQQAQPQQEHRVPLRELMEERDRRQRLEAHTQELTRVVMALQQQMLPQQHPQQQPQGPETIFDHPEQYLDQRVVTPLRQEGQMYMMQIKDGLSREMANTQFGAEEVNAALGQMQQIRQTPQGDFVFRQIMQSGHPYGELVKWHRTARAQAAIGADPQAWLRHQQEAWANNPKVQEYVINLARARAAQQGAQGQAPNVQLPPSLSSVRSSSGRVDNGGDLSSASLYDFATK
jgi:hypothetical protein